MIRFLFCFLIFAFSALPAYALDMRDFKTIPVLHEGRLKPLDSFARAELKKFSGGDRLKNQTAIDWLAETIFTPGTAIGDPVFRIDGANLRHSLGLTDREIPIYSFEELVPGLRKTSDAVTELLKADPKNLDRDQKQLLQIHDDAFAYTALLRSLSLLLPLDVHLPAKYKLSTDAISYLDLKKLEQDLDRDVKKIVTAKGENINRYTNEEKATALLAFQLQLMSSAARDNDILKIVPPQWQSDNDSWHAPWELLQKGEGSPQTAELLTLWRGMGKAYIQKDDKGWTDASNQALRKVADKSRLMRLKLETFQNTVSPFRISTALYIFAFIATLFFFVFGKKYLYLAGWLFLACGLIVHGGGFCLRVYLLMRPPVGTLYESLIFVSAVTVLISLIIEKYTRNAAGLLIGGISGLLLGFLSFSFAGDGDTMEMLTAVLNTNFWLATHVLCITMGYGWCILAAIFAHLYLAAPFLKMEKFKTPQMLFILHSLAVIALLFTTVGTILGGIWADQSWGRFWGWDPKENGALLIVLWIIWLLHGKAGKQLDTCQFLAGLAFLNVIVGISWIGVNLLGVGLHSYGFTQGLFYGLGLFILTELALIAALWHFNRKAGFDA